MPLSHSTDVGGIKIHYRRLGSGEPILLLHGWLQETEKYLPLVNELTSRGFEVIFPDLPGFGQSDEPPSSWDSIDYAKFTSKFMQNLNITKYNLVAHSFGGQIAVQISLLNPEQIKSMVLTGAAAIRPRPSLKVVIFQLIAKIGKLLLPKDFGKKLLYFLAGEHDYEKASKRMQEVFKNVREQNLKSKLPNVTTRTLLLWGAKDGATPLKLGKQMNLLMPNSTLIIFDDIGHKLPYAKATKAAEGIEAFFRIIN